MSKPNKKALRRALWLLRAGVPHCDVCGHEARYRNAERTEFACYPHRAGFCNLPMEYVAHGDGWMPEKRKDLLSVIRAYHADLPRCSCGNVSVWGQRPAPTSPARREYRCDDGHYTVRDIELTPWAPAVDMLARPDMAGVIPPEDGAICLPSGMSGLAGLGSQ